jgi:hypothetical protein
MVARLCRLGAMTPQKLGLLIGAVLGLVFVLVNAATLPTGIATAVRGLGAVAFLLVLLVAIRRPSRPAAPGRAGGMGFGTGYWLVVGAEVIAIVVGVRLVTGPLDAPDAGVAWVALVVGLHFVALAVVWAQPSFHWLGGSIAGCGLLGLVLGFTGSPTAAVHTVGGILPGALLLGFALWGVLSSTESSRVRRGATVGAAE